MPRPVPAIAAFAVAAVGIGFYSAMDAVMKGLVLGIGAYNAMLWRMIASAVLSGAIYAAMRPRRPGAAVMRIHLIRGALLAVMALLFFWGLGRLPMAQAIALAFIAPILSLFLAALILKERIGARTIGASLLAFAGVLVILWGQARGELGPEAFWGAVAVLLSALCYAWNIILMRQQALVAGPIEIVFSGSAIAVLLYLPAAPFLGVVPAAELWPSVAGSAVLTVIALSLLSWAYARAEASYLAPTEYTGFLWASFFGWTVFGERVSPFTVAGAAFIITGCAIAARRRRGPAVAG